MKVNILVTSKINKKDDRNIKYINSDNICDFCKDIILDDIKDKKIINKSLEKAILASIVTNETKNNKLNIISEDTNIYDFISESIFQEIGVDELLEKTTKLPLLLKNKIYELCNIYKKYIEELKNNNYITQEQILSIFINKDVKIAQDVVILPIENYNKLILHVVKKIILSGNNTTIIFKQMPKHIKNNRAYSNASLAKMEIIEFVKEKNIPFSGQIEDVNLKNEKLILWNEFFSVHLKTKNTITEKIHINKAITMDDEIKVMVDNIKKEHLSGTNYENMSIYSPNIEEYVPYIKGALDNANIPYKINAEKSFTETYLYKYLVTLLDICKTRITAESLLKIIQSDYIDICNKDKEDIALFFERFGKNINKALKTGDKYYPEETKKIKPTVEMFYAIIKETQSNFNDSVTIRDFLFSLLDYLEKTKITTVLSKKENKTLLKNEWEAFLAVFNTLQKISDTETCLITNFEKVFKVISKETIVNSNNIYNDAIIISNINYINNDKKTIFILGATDNITKDTENYNILNDYEKRIVNTIINTKFFTDEDVNDFNNLRLFNLLLSWQEKLFISWPNNNKKGEKLHSLTTLNNIIKIFEPEKEKSTTTNNEQEERFLDFICKLKDEKEKGFTADIIEDYFEFCDEPKYIERLRSVINNIVKDKTKINSENAASIYKEKEFFSATRLESFNKCPFKHYIDYGVLPQQIERFEESSLDKGDYYHQAFNLFYKKIEKEDISIDTMTKENIETILEPIFKKIERNHNDDFLENTYKGLYEKQRMRNKTISSIWASIQQMKKSSFYCEATEFKIGTTVKFPITLKDGTIVNITGIIDRYDKFLAPDKDYVRVIDYKSGNKKFSEEELNDGIQLQLPLYIKALTLEGNEIAGMYYFHIQNPIMDVDKNENDKLKKYQLSGPTIKEELVITNSDKDMLTEDKSNVIQVSKTKAGVYSSTSKVLSLDDFNNLLEKAQDIAINTIEKILSGETKANPTKKIDVCKYCKYNQICHYL